MLKICKDFGGELPCPLFAFWSAPTQWRDDFQPYLNSTDPLSSLILTFECITIQGIHIFLTTELCNFIYEYLNFHLQ